MTLRSSERFKKFAKIATGILFLVYVELGVLNLLYPHVPPPWLEKYIGIPLTGLLLVFLVVCVYLMIASSNAASNSLHLRETGGYERELLKIWWCPFLGVVVLWVVRSIRKIDPGY